MAIVCGNTFVLKPSERDPSSVLYLAELAAEAGLPPGVFNVVNGGKEAVDAILTDSRIQAVSFVGSSPITEYVYTTGTAHGRRVQLGRHQDHIVVMPDADVDHTDDTLIGAGYGSSGERCIAISVVDPFGNESPTPWSRNSSTRGGPEGRSFDGPTRRYGSPGHRGAFRQGQGLRGSGRQGRRRALVDGRGFSSRPRGRLFPGRLPVRQREARHEDLQRRNFRTGASVVRAKAWHEAMD